MQFAPTRSARNERRRRGEESVGAADGMLRNARICCHQRSPAHANACLLKELQRRLKLISD